MIATFNSALSFTNAGIAQWHVASVSGNKPNLNYSIAPLVKIRCSQNLDLRCVLLSDPAPKVAGKRVLNLV